MMDSDVDESEDFVSYGTPLDPIEEDEIPRKKPLNIEEQVVLDKQGRRRFHGAFTGGFSAGFFNSVGSLEGWTPSTFKSSRSDRNQKYSQNPEDFMDEEDMEEFGIAPKVIRATSDFREQQTSKRKRNVPSDGPIPGEPVLHLFLQPVRDTVGVRLLKKMGWKPGQGVGPRLTRKEKKKSAKEREKVHKKVYGCSLPDEFHGTAAQSHASDSSDDEEKENEEEILYAPDDIQPFICVPKDDVFGIGYSGLDRRPILSSSKFGPQKKSILNMIENKKKISIAGQAFGVGAFEDEDEDIYSTEDMSHYDFALEDATEKKKDTKKSSRWDHPTGESCNYVGEPLEGFTLAQTSPPIVFFPPPKLPPDYQPVHKVQKSRFEPTDDTSAKGDGRKKGLGRHNLTASDREAIISGTRKTASVEAVKIKVEPKSNEECSANSRQSTGENSSSAISTEDSRERTHFQPFAADPDKQRRYEQYLGLLKFNQKERLAELQPLSMTEWERDREKMEFEQAARLYQPLSNFMSDRFVSAVHPDVGDEGSPSVVSFTKEEVSEKVNAAKMKMYGKLTRETLTWTPCSLLYKRFNVPDPGTSAEQDVKKSGTKFSVFDFMASQAHNSLTSVTSESPTDAGKSLKECVEAAPAKPTKAAEKEKTIFPELPVEAHAENEEKFPDPPNKIDLFKAIFQSSSESESEDEPAIETVEKSAASSSVRPPSSKDSNDNSLISATAASESNVLRNTSPPRGVFANLDLDAINPRLKVQEGKDKVKEQPKSSPPKPAIKDVYFDACAYGPKLPSVSKVWIPPSNLNDLSKSNEKRLSESNSSSEGEWVEKSSHRHKKSKHKSKKSKKHKSKHKHKRK